MKFCKIFAAIAMMAMPLTLSAQTVTVNQTATPGPDVFNNISDALAAVQADPASPDLVQITDSATYEEAISIYSPVVLEAIGASKATMALKSNSNGTPMPGQSTGNGGIWINLPDTLSTGTVVIRNFNILPALNDTTLSSRLRTAIENGNNNLYLEVDNCIITANENGQPIVTDPYTSRIYAVFPNSTGVPEPYNPDIVMFGAHGIVLGRTYTGYAELAGVELLLKDSVVSHFKNDYHPEATEPERFPTGIVMHSPYGEDPNGANWDPSKVRITRIEGASGVSYTDANISVAGDLNIEGTSPDQPVYLRSSASYAIRLDGPAFNYRTFKNMAIIDMSESGIYDRGFGPIRWSMDHCKMFQCLQHMVLVDVSKTGTVITHGAVGHILIKDSTLVAGRYHATNGIDKHPFRLGTDTVCSIHFENSIIGGKKGWPIRPANTIALAGSNFTTIDGSAFITQGPYALRETNPFSRGPGSTLPSNVTSYYAIDPSFLVTDGSGANYVTDPGFFDVQNEAYATKNSVGGPLAGAADYVGGVSSSVSDWSVY